MDSEEKRRAISRYDQRLSELGPTVQALGWRDRPQQDLRFRVLADIDSLVGKSVLDVGCGYGDLLDYLVARGERPGYVGVDINSRLLDIARKRHPGVRFEQRDILLDVPSERFDYVVESGVLNHKSKDNETFARDLLTAMYGLCARGVAANMMGDYVDYQEERLHYYSPEAMFRFAKSLSQYVVLRQDYPLYEFTLYIYKQSPTEQPQNPAGA